MPKNSKPKVVVLRPVEQPVRIEYVNGRKDWMQNGRHHRLDGPAVVTENGDQYWMVNGAYHREEGPALHYHNGAKTYYLNNVTYSEKRFFEMIKDIRIRRALDSLEKFSDKYGSGKDAAKAGYAVIKFLQGECDHTFKMPNEECELCDSRT
jgi:hypothetical protein